MTLGGELLVLVMSTLWLVIVGFGAAAMVARINRRTLRNFPKGVGKLFYFAPVALLVAWLLYWLFGALIQGRIKLPVRGPDFHFYVASSPLGFRVVFGVTFVLTAMASAVMAAATYLVLRNDQAGV